MEVCMSALLLSAFLYLNALSLVFLLCIGVGMAAPEGQRRTVWALVRDYCLVATPPAPPDNKASLFTAETGILGRMSCCLLRRQR